MATDALVESLGHIVLDEFLDQVAQMSLAEDDEVIETLVLDGFTKRSAYGLQLGLCAGIFTLGLIRFRGQVGYVVPSLVSMLSRARADVTAAVPCAAWA